MARDPRFDVLFEPVKIGPVTAPNRFYQVPHASGATNAMPRVRAGMRGIKAEGGWGVVNTGAVSIHPSSDDAPLPFATMWDDDDIRAHALMTDAVHEHGALAGVELFHGGAVVMNRNTRLPLLSPSGVPWMATDALFMSAIRPKPMDKSDIRDILRWQAEAAKRSISAGFDIVYVYAGMGYLPYEFLLPEYNKREDEYGGSIANRVRLIAEMIEVTREAVGDRAAVALRISLEELRKRPSENAPSEAHEAVAALADLPDLWDVKMDSSPTDCGPSRYRGEAAHEPVIDFVRSLTTKPVVGVGRFTSPDTMVSQIRRGVLDLIGGARPSIADPFLPNKIREGREDDIRECIGCNMCIASWHEGVVVRCTQNPTFGEEWRRGWHPESPALTGMTDSALIVGSGPAGLEAALTLARRGYQVTVAEKSAKMGGRVLFESSLPGLGQWRRVIDYRLGQLRRMSNVSLYTESPLEADEVLEFRADRVAIATGAKWLAELYSPLEIPHGEIDHPAIFTPTDLAEGRLPSGPTAIFDFDGHVIGGAIAEHIAALGLETHYVTPAGAASVWTINSNERGTVHASLRARGVSLHHHLHVTGFDGATLSLADLYSEEARELACQSLVIVGTKLGNRALYDALTARAGDVAAAGIKSVELIGDADTPGAIAHAVYSGHAYAVGVDGRPRSELLRDAPFSHLSDGPLPMRMTG
ncbi:FAD-dependent oxidoreductase [Rhodobacteraceae bacterium NNCM2]|nr:FAD-dependent oxidoreductase [Coraliihabitans acroporae]